MPKIAYSEEERKQIREALILCSLELFAKQGIGHTTVEQIYQQVGISRTFFLYFFSNEGRSDHGGILSSTAANHQLCE